MSTDPHQCAATTRSGSVGPASASTWSGSASLPSQTWRTFLDNHIESLVSVDFFTAPMIGFQTGQSNPKLKETGEMKHLVEKNRMAHLPINVLSYRNRRQRPKIGRLVRRSSVSIPGEQHPHIRATDIAVYGSAQQPRHAPTQVQSQTSRLPCTWSTRLTPQPRGQRRHRMKDPLNPL